MSTSKSSISKTIQSTTKSTTKPRTKSTTLFYTTTVLTTTPVTATQVTCSCQVKKVQRADVCQQGSNEWKDQATRAKYLRVATLDDAKATKDTWCKTTGKWELGGADGAKFYGQGYKCQVEKFDSSKLKSDQGCPSTWASFLMCLACPGPGAK